MYQFSGKLLEYTRGEYEGSPYAIAKIRSSSIGDNRIISYKVDLKKCPQDMTPYLDEEISFEAGVAVGANSSAVLKIVSFKA